MLKKLLCALLIVAILLSCTSCLSDTLNDAANDNGVTELNTETEKVIESTTEQVTDGETNKAPFETESSEPSESEKNENSKDDEELNKPSGDLSDKESTDIPSADIPDAPNDSENGSGSGDSNEENDNGNTNDENDGDQNKGDGNESDENGTNNTPPSPPSTEPKKAIFIGNSFIYWGGCVTFITNDDSNDALRLAGGDKGYFNEICKANNMSVDVYNYTFGGKNLNWIYENKLNKLSKSFLDDMDYVFISEAGENSSSFKTSFKRVAGLFPNAEEIVYLAHAYTYSTNATNIINALPELAQDGVKIVAWGELVTDVYNGNVRVPNSKLRYNKNTFIKNMTSSEVMDDRAAVTSLSGKGDSYHQNPLSGYVTAQMCFSVITGISAVGQKYDFCWDKTIAPQYDLENFLTYQYGKNQTSNFIEVFNSPDDMLGLQTLMDEYLKKYN